MFKKTHTAISAMTFVSSLVVLTASASAQQAPFQFPQQPQVQQQVQTQAQFDVTPNTSSQHPYMPSQNLAAASQFLVDPHDSRTNTVSYSPYLGRSHGNIYYKAPTTRQLVDDRPHIISTSAAFQGKFANRRAGARQLDAQNRRSGYRILGGNPQPAATQTHSAQRKVRIIRYAVPVRVPTTVRQQRIIQQPVQQPIIQQYVQQPTQYYVQQPQVRYTQVQPSYGQYYTSQQVAAPVQYGTVSYGTPSFQQSYTTGVTNGSLSANGFGLTQPSFQQPFPVVQR